MMAVDDLTPLSLAEACAEVKWNDDNVSRRLGMTLDRIAPGAVPLSFEITDDMIDDHATCHGRYIFAISDLAFAFACNDCNRRAVAQHCSITYLSTAHKGDRITADAAEVSRRGRYGICDVKITNQNGDTIAEFRDHSRTVKDTHLPETA